MKRKRPKKFNLNVSCHSRLRKRWRNWLSKISVDLSHLLGKREIFWGLQEVAKENPRILEQGAFFDWMCTNYIVTATIGVRGLTDQRNDVHSLWKIAYEILEHPGVINRRAHCSLYKGMPNRELDLGNMTFNNVVGKGRDILRKTDIRKDLQALEKSSERVRKFVNKRIAHRTPAGQLRKLPRFNELDKAMDVIDQIFCKYNLLLNATGMTSAHATRQYNWMETLYEPLIKPGSKLNPETS